MRITNNIRKHIHILLLLCVAVATVLVSCTTDHGIPAALSDRALVAAVASKDSALRFLASVDSSEARSESVRARYGVIRLLADYHLDKCQSDDSSMIAIERYFDHSGDNPEVKAVAKIAIGLTHELAGDDDKALPCYVSAANMLHGSSEWLLLYTVYSHWGWLLKVEPPYTMAMKNLRIAEKYARRLGDTNRIARVLGMQGWSLLFCDRFAASHPLFDRAIAMSRNGGIWLSWLYKSKASAFEMEGNHVRALEYVNLAIAALRKPDKSLDGIKGTCFIGLGQYDSARVYIERGRLDKFHYQKATYYSEMSDLWRVHGDYKAALQYKSLYCMEVDSQYEEDRNKQLAQAERRYNYAIVAAERDNLKLANGRKTALMAALVGVLCAAVAVFSFLHQRYRHRTENALRMKENLLQQTLSQMKERNYELMQTQREAQDKEMALMKSLSTKDEQIDHLRQQQRELKMRMLSNSDVIHKIEQLPSMNEKKKINSARNIALTADEQQNLIDSTNVCYDNFVDRLVAQFSDLTTDDVCLCCLLKLGVSAQDQGLLLNVSDATLRTRKYRLKKKKMLIGDEYETLNDFISSF